jgi:hypothetical protein
MKNGNANTEILNSGWAHIGKVTQWALSKLRGNQFHLYIAIVRRTVGYSQYTSELTSYADLNKLTGIPIRTIEDTMPKLIEQGFIIKLATNQVANAGKLPYKYRLNMKLHNFPSLGKLKQGRDDVAPIKQPWDERTRLYFIDATESILPLYTGNNPDNRRSPEWFNHTFSTDLSEVVYPTTEQLLIYLKEQS